MGRLSVQHLFNSVSPDSAHKTLSSPLSSKPDEDATPIPVDQDTAPLFYSARCDAVVKHQALAASEQRFLKPFPQPELNSLCFSVYETSSEYSQNLEQQNLANGKTDRPTSVQDDVNPTLSTTVTAFAGTTSSESCLNSYTDDIFPFPAFPLASDPYFSKLESLSPLTYPDSSPAGRHSVTSHVESLNTSPSVSPRARSSDRIAYSGQVNSSTDPFLLPDFSPCTSKLARSTEERNQQVLRETTQNALLQSVSLVDQESILETETPCLAVQEKVVAETTKTDAQRVSQPESPDKTQNEESLWQRLQAWTSSFAVHMAPLAATKTTPQQTETSAASLRRVVSLHKPVLPNRSSRSSDTGSANLFSTTKGTLSGEQQLSAQKSPEQSKRDIAALKCQTFKVLPEKAPESLKKNQYVTQKLFLPLSPRFSCISPLNYSTLDESCSASDDHEGTSGKRGSFGKDYVVSGWPNALTRSSIRFKSSIGGLLFLFVLLVAWLLELSPVSDQYLA